MNKNTLFAIKHRVEKRGAFKFEINSPLRSFDTFSFVIHSGGLHWKNTHGQRVLIKFAAILYRL